MMIAKDGYVKHVTYMADVRNLYHISAANPRQTTTKIKHVRKNWTKLANSMTVIMVMNISLTTNITVQHLPSTADSHSTNQDTCFYGTRMLTNHIHKQSKWIHFSIHLPVS